MGRTLHRVPQYARNARLRRRRGAPDPLPVRPLCGTGVGPSYSQSQDGPSTGRLPIGRGCRAARLELLSSDGNSSDGNKRAPSLPTPSRWSAPAPREPLSQWRRLLLLRRTSQPQLSPRATLQLWNVSSGPSSAWVQAAVGPAHPVRPGTIFPLTDVLRSVVFTC